MSPEPFGSGTSASIFIIGPFNRDAGITFTRPALENTERPVTVSEGTNRLVPSTKLKVGDVVLVEAGDMIPSDGEVIEGMASVNEAAITGESAPVIRE